MGGHKTFGCSSHKLPPIPDALNAGAISLWSGSIGSIPAGWVLCDGNNGTPDLRDKFIIGAGDTYNPDDNGGALNHLHSFTGNGHTHQSQGSGALLAGSGQTIFTYGSTSSGNTDNADGRPPYYALAYIMKT